MSWNADTDSLVVLHAKLELIKKQVSTIHQLHCEDTK